LQRIVLDTSLRTPLDSQLVKTAYQDVLIFFSQAEVAAQKALEARGVRLQQIPHRGSRISLQDALVRLAEMQITSVLLEGGAQVYSSALNQGLVDELVLFYAPTFFGKSAVPMLSEIDGVPQIEDYSLKQFGHDFALESRLHDPWSEVI
jgi:diaminohydroxyphosphoribosylaminopyrimidine deaminase / 5-amino-6-(5-phosphoribosylamino)uracil reductase